MAMPRRGALVLEGIPPSGKGGGIAIASVRGWSRIEWAAPNRSEAFG